MRAMLHRREPPALQILVLELAHGARNGWRLMLRDRDRRRAALLSVGLHLLLVLLVLWLLRMPEPRTTPTYLVIDIGVPALAEEVTQAPTADLPAPPAARPQVEDVEVGVPQAATVPQPQPATPEPAPQTAQPPAPDPVPAAPEPVVEAAPSPPVPTPAVPSAVPEVPVERVAATPLPEIVIPELAPTPLAQRVEVPVPAVATVVPEARAIAPTPTVSVVAPLPVPTPALRAEIPSPSSVPVPTVTSEIPQPAAVPRPEIASEVVAARPVTVPQVRADVSPARDVAVVPQVAVSAPLAIPTPQLRAEVLAPEPTPDAPEVDASVAAAAATSAGSRDVTAPAGGDAARAGQVGPVTDLPEELGLGAAAGPDGSDQPTGSPAPPSTPFRQALERPMAVVVDNLRGYPQQGLAPASQIHELPVEGGLTRLMLVFDRTDPERVGPVRSARDYMVELSRSMNAVMVHDGGSPGALAAIAADRLATLNSFTSGELFSRGDGSAPYNLFAGGDALRTAVNRLAIGRGRTVAGVIYHPQFDADDVAEVKVRFGAAYETGFRYESGVNAYRWIRNGSAASDASGQAVLVDGVLVAAIEARAIPGDAEGRLYIPMRGGAATLYLRGKAVQGEWSLSSGGLGLQFATPEGGVDLTPFKLWVVYTPAFDRVVAE
jgi:hypothetical protein